MAPPMRSTFSHFCTPELKIMLSNSIPKGFLVGGDFGLNRLECSRENRPTDKLLLVICKING